jgi:hypothetical protein
VKLNSLIKSKKMKTKLFNMIAAATLLSMPIAIFGQAPALGTTANYVLFSTNGALTNTGLSHLTGNVGTNNGSSTAFGNVNGQMHAQDGSSAAAAADLLIAYNQLNSTVATFFPAPSLGGGQSLNAGVYSISGNSTLNGTLTLNGQGNANAVFIIKIQGAFSTSAGSRVILSNSALACNVFWKIEGAVNMAAGTTMKGTVIVNNAAITMSSGTSLEGRALTTAGAIGVNQVLAYTPIGCGSPSLMGPASPTLASSACYAIFSGNGSVANTGISSAIGDIGTNVGLTTGYNALNVVGVIHPIPDGNTAACGSDLLLAYTYLNTLPYDIELLYPAQFGFNLVLTPHVYRMNGATAFTDTLFLDGGGNANAVFVLQLNGALSTSTYAKVSLTNGTQPQNVFWKVEGSVNINNYTEFVGTIICNNGAVNLTQGVRIDGRALTTNGALSTAAVTVNIPSSCTSTTVAPVVISSQPANKTVCAGQAALFMVAANGSSLTYQWRKGTTNLINGGSISGATTPTLIVNPASQADASTLYNVMVSGAATAKDSSVKVSLIVNSLPAISTEPSDVVTCLGTSAVFSIVATGSGLSYQWKKGPILLVNGTNISGATTPVLTINSVSASDLGGGYHADIVGTCTPNATSLNAVLVKCNLTGIKETENQAEVIGLYPNPFTEELNITVYEASQINKSELRIYNLLGAEILTVELNQEQTTVKTNELVRGLYFYKVVNANKTIQSGKLFSQ